MSSVLHSQRTWDNANQQGSQKNVSLEQSSLGPETTPACPLAFIPVDTLSSERKPPHLTFTESATLLSSLPDLPPGQCEPPGLGPHLVHPLSNKYQGCPEFAMLETWSELARGISVYRVQAPLWGQVLGSWNSPQSAGTAMRAGLGQLKNWGFK